jgi:NAD(P)-dependent dehydrogenase (short-subunit alcohol dehydrogenase family)
MASSTQVAMNATLRRLEDKVAVITGGAAGLGEATVRLFVRNGARVVIVDIDDEAGERLMTELGDASARYVHCDVRKESDVAAAVSYAVSTFGKLDIYFSNAGIFRIDPIPLSRLSTFFVFSVSVSLDSVCVSLSHDESMSHVWHHSYMSKNRLHSCTAARLFY